jgi:hypothetical protein
MARLHTRLFENYRQWAKSGQGRLKEIQAYKSGEKQPVGTVKYGKDYAHKYNAAGKS